MFIKVCPKCGVERCPQALCLDYTMARVGTTPKKAKFLPQKIVVLRVFIWFYQVCSFQFKALLIILMAGFSFIFCIKTKEKPVLKLYLQL